ncbi:MAG: type II and III secretion system protein [Armatimonadetes bacterium]|nr:type II and III secretion system protein [Armatimonadota bacterium]
MRTTDLSQGARHCHLLAVLFGVLMVVAGLPRPAVAQDFGPTVQADAAPGTVVKLISVKGKDPAAVAATLKALTARAEAQEHVPLPVFVRLASEEIVAHALPQDVKAAEELLAVLPSSANLEACLVRLQYFRDTKMLAEMVKMAQARLAPDVEVKEFAAEGDDTSSPAGDTTHQGLKSTRAAIMLCGPHDQVTSLRRWLNLLDAPLPQMRLDLWSLQISGGKRDEVSKRAQEAQAKIAQTRQLVTDYLWLLQGYARAEQNRELATSQALAQAQEKNLGDVVASVRGLQGGGFRVLDTSLRVALEKLGNAAEQQRQAAAMAHQRATALASYRGPLGAILYLLSTSERASAGDFIAWLRSEAKSGTARDIVQRQAEWLSRGSKERLDDDAVIAELTPRRLFSVVERLQGPAGSGLQAFVEQSSRAQRDQGRPEELAVATANAEAELAEYERALTADVQELFLNPLLADLRGTVVTRTASGLTSVGATSITVLSGYQANVTGAAMSYFDVTPEPNIDAEKLAEAVSGGAAPWKLLLESLATRDKVWAAMTEGAELTFTPIVLPGGGSAEVTVDVTVSHGDPGGGGAPVYPSGAPVPLSRVAKHSASTKVRLEPLDMFTLSSFGLATTHPRTDFVVPLLGRIPFLGQMFRFPRRPDHVIHESLLLVYSTILPTAPDLAELLVVDPEGLLPADSKAAQPKKPAGAPQ